MSGAMNRHCIPGLTMSTALTGNFAGSPGIIKTMHTGLARTRIALCQRPGKEANGRNRRYDLAWKDLCSVLNALSK